MEGVGIEANRTAASQGRWVEPGVSSALCLLASDGHNAEGRQLPHCLYSESIAPFLRFDGPQPNQLYVVGGRDEQQDPLDAVEMFDTWHGRWTTCPGMLSRRAGCSAAVLPDGRLLVVGGYDEGGIAEGLLASCEVFDPVLQAWELLSATLGRARWGHGCASLQGMVFAVGGCSLPPGAPPDEALMETLRSCEVYDLAAGTWVPCAELRVARAGARVVALGDRHLAAVGGCDDVFGRAELLPTVELFDVHAGSWTLLEPQLSMPRTTAGVAPLDDRQILIIGGTTAQASGEVYRVPELKKADAAAQRTTEEAAAGRSPKRPPVCQLTEGRMGCQAVAMKLPAPSGDYPLCTRQCVLVVGGENGDEDLDIEFRQFRSIPVFDVEADDWRPEKSFPAIPTPRTAMALVVGPGRIAGCP
mmetsp:Transcript_133284/g.414427  ORF Transcript_133284/g.414427 Transcript_133284/m.414427 type:complete len:416 (-) Transcript_133284:307-1554(-)